MKQIGEISEIKRKLDKPSNVVDYIFFKKYGAIPPYLSRKTGVLDDYSPLIS